MTDLGTLTLDQLRLLVAVAETGTFSGAARRLHRAQSSVSYGIAHLEETLGVRLFERGGRRPVLSETGRALLEDARRVLDAAGRLRARAAAMTEGAEAAVHLAIDAICPATLLVELGRAFQARFPQTALILRSDVLEAVPALVLDRSCSIGIAGPAGAEHESLEARLLGHVAMVPVASTEHPLASLPPPIGTAQIRDAVQVVISQSTSAALGSRRSVLSAITWRVADPSTKLTLIRAGLGWGTLPLDLVREDLDAGRLVRLHLEAWGEAPLLVPLSVVTRGSDPPGPAGQWVCATLVELGARLLRVAPPAPDLPEGQRLHLGVLAGTIEVPDDFDAPLVDFERAFDGTED